MTEDKIQKTPNKDTKRLPINTDVIFEDEDPSTEEDDKLWSEVAAELAASKSLKKTKDY